MLDKGSKIRIKSRHGIPGNVVEVKEGFASVLCKGKTEWFPLTDLEEANDEFLNRMLKGELDEAEDFILAMDAYRLHTAQLWDPYVLAASNRIRVFPHQIHEVMWALDNPRILIADEVGLGKTIIAALVAAELQARGIVKKSIYIVPKSLILKWKDELEEKFQINVKILGSSYKRVDDDTFKDEEFSYIASIDYLKQDSIKERLKNVNLDMVVIDEAHKMKHATERMKLGEMISERCHNIILLTATPHDGHDDDFLTRMRLLDPWITDVSTSNHLWVRNIKEDVLDIDGRQVFPPRTSQTIEIKLSDAESKVYTMLDEYMNNRTSEARTPQQTGAARFLRILFRKRASSSMRALEISLGRRREKLGTVDIRDVLHGQKNMAQAEEDFEEESQEETLRKIEGYTASTDIEQEKQELEQLIEGVRGLGGMDSKYEEISENIIKNIKSDDSNAKIIIFTEYGDTLDFLYDKLSQHYKVGKINGKMGITERKDALGEFRKPDGNEILLCTDAAGEGIDMQFCNIEINYDIPWNPNKLEQRMGRIHRIGQSRNVHYYNFIVDSARSIDGYIFKMLLDKIDRIRDAMNDKIYDILGRMVTEDEIRKLYAELAEIPRSKWEPKVMEMASKIEENKEKILQENEKLLTANRFDRTNLESINEIRKYAIDKGEIKRFVETYLAMNNGNFQLLDQGNQTYRISVPIEAARMLEHPIFDGTFDRDVAIRQNLDYLALGNKNIVGIIKHVSKPSVTCLEHETKKGLISVYLLTITDMSGKARNAKILCLFQNEDGEINEVDPRSLWNYESSELKDIDTSRLISFNERSDDHARSKLKKLEDVTRLKMVKIKEAHKKIVVNHYATKTDTLNSQIAEHEKNIGSGPHIEKAIKNKKRKLDALKKEHDERIGHVNYEYEMKGTLEMIGMAWVIPKLKANIRTEIEKSGQNAVIEYERKTAPTTDDQELVKDVSDRDCGYDVESFNEKCIEVKSFKTTGEPKITSHEWETARRMEDNYWLYIVENAITNPKITTFQNPFRVFKDTIHREQVVDYRYVIRGWKQKLQDS